MIRKFTVISAAVVAVAGLAFAASGSGLAWACDGNQTADAKTASAACSATKTASAACSATKTASAACSATKTASSSSCSFSTSSYASANRCKSSGKAAVAGYSKKAENDNAALKELVDEIPLANNKRLVVTGAMECGKCTAKTTASCAPLFKTTDGKTYPLWKSSMVKNMQKDSASEYEVSTRVKKVNGIKYLDVVAYKTM